MQELAKGTVEAIKSHLVFRLAPLEQRILKLEVTNADLRAEISDLKRELGYGIDDEARLRAIK
jgi:hypothetical protein